MKALKALVAAMGILIVVGIALVGYALSRGKTQPGSGTSTVQASAPESKGGYFTSDVPVPAGAKLEQVTATGDRIVLRFMGPDGERLVLLDSHTGQLAGTIALVPEKN